MSAETVVLVMTLAPLAFIGVDIWLAVDGRKGNTYSEILRATGRKWQPLIMLVCFGFGLLAGHWWWAPTVIVPCGVGS